MRATGPFEVKINPLPAYHNDPGSPLGHMSLDKRFHGDLEATSKGEMLTAMSPVKGSAGYVAIEQVTGTLAGRSGSFVFQHSSTMTRGEPRQNIFVVPDSATGELTGLSGTMTVIIAPGGAHSYEFDYDLPDS